MIENMLVLLLAVVLDLAFGDPPNRWHPVAWLGKFIALEIKAIPKSNKTLAFLSGMFVVVVTVAAVTVAAYLTLSYLHNLNLIAYIIVAAFFLKFTFSMKTLRQTAFRVKGLLEQGKVPEARGAVKALVGRDTAGLDKGHVISATVEAVAESSCDGIIAPLLYFLLFGVPGAIVYRVINTFDSMIGYRGKFEYIGKFAARLDDVANFVPARIGSLLLVLASARNRKNAGLAWQIMLRDHSNTPSPNGGWTMSAMAGALNVQLEKIGFYRLGDPGRPLTTQDIADSWRIVLSASLSWCMTLVLIEGGLFAAAQA